MPSFQTWFDKLLDIAFPPRCAACRKAGSWFCDGCLSNIRIEPDDSCPDGIDVCTSFVPYANREMRILVTRLKYQSASCLLPAIQNIVQKSGYRADPEWTVTWVPASDQRLKERGFDHAKRIAETVSSNALPLLERARHTLANATLEQPELRQGNVSGAFRAIRPIPEKVILVDDVRTSGATASACAKTLRERGAKHIHLVTLAYGG